MACSRITQAPALMGGKPCIEGLRISVDTIVGLVASGTSRERILRAYPLLEPANPDEATLLTSIRNGETSISK